MKIIYSLLKKIYTLSNVLPSLNFDMIVPLVVGNTFKYRCLCLCVCVCVYAGIRMVVSLWLRQFVSAAWSSWAWLLDCMPASPPPGQLVYGLPEQHKASGREEKKKKKENDKEEE